MATPSQAAMLATELTEHYLLGELASRAGIVGAAELKHDSARLLAGVEQRLGAEIVPGIIASPPESGAIWATISSAAAKLRLGAAKLASEAVTKGSAHLPLLATAAGAYITYSWVTADERVRLEEVRQKADVVRASWDSVAPSERADIVKSFVDSTTGGGGMSFGSIVGLAIAGIGVVLLVRLLK